MSDATKPRLTLVGARAPHAGYAAPASPAPALEFALDLSQIGYWEFDLETGSGTFSDTWLEIAGWTREAWETVPDPWTARCHPDDRDRAHHDLNAHLAGQSKTFEIEYRQLTESGDWRWLLNRGGVSERDTGGRPRRIVGTTINVDARKRAEHALRESELRYRAVAELAGGFVQEYVFDAQDSPVFTWATDGIEQVLGLTVEDMMKRGGWQSMILPEDSPAGYERLARQSRGESTSGVMRVINARGELRWLHMMARPFIDEDGGSSRVVGVVRDITESRQMQEALRHSEFRYRTVAALTPGYAHEFRVHPDGRAELVWASEGFRDVYGCDYEEWNRRGGWEAFCHPDDLAASAQRECRWGSGEQTAGVARIIDLKGETRWLRCINRPLLDPATGRITATVGIGHDMTDIMEAQEAARVSEERFRIAVDAMAGLIYETDLDTGVVLRWPGLERLLGFGPGEIPETLSAWDDLVHPEDRVPVPSDDVELPTNSDGVIEFEYRVRNSAGGYEHVLDRSVLLRDAAGRLHRRIGCMTNVSERKRLERALLDIANREQQRIGNDLHDGIGQELTGVALLLRSLTHQLARDCPQAVPTAEQAIALVNRTIENARMLARGLSPANLERGGLDFALRELSLQLARASGVPIGFTSRGAARLRLDEIASNHLYRIAQEAISNALRHASATHIRVDLNVTQRRVRLTVADDGVGLDPDADSGTGLGLKIMQYRARMVGGELLVESGAPRGLVITCTCVQPAA
jgi:PAS domain S-box-containing protein